MNTKMIFLDMDGTLLDDDKNLPKVNREAIDAALEAGHKVLISDAPMGTDIIKYGYPIGHSTADLKEGDWVNEDNLKTNLSGLHAHSLLADAHRLSDTLVLGCRIDISQPCPLLIGQHPRFHTLAPCLSEFRCEWSVNELCGQRSWEWVYLHLPYFL